MHQLYRESVNSVASAHDTIVVGDQLIATASTGLAGRPGPRQGGQDIQRVMFGTDPITGPVPPPGGAAQQHASTDNPPASTAERPKETVLLVEDDDGVRRFSRRGLEWAGYHVVEAADGHEALAYATRHPAPIHLLMTDVVMPGMDGRTLWERFAVLHPETKVLFVSGYMSNAIVTHDIQEASLPFLQKPFNLAALAAAALAALQAASREGERDDERRPEGGTTPPDQDQVGS